MAVTISPPPASIGRRLSAWFELGRAPFLVVGILPFILGAALGSAVAGGYDWATAAVGLAAVVTIMLTTYFWGEYADYDGDAYGSTRGKNRFSGGSLVVQRGLLGRRVPLWAGAVTATVSLLLGLYIVFVRAGGWVALALGVFGAACGFFYSVPPFRWVSRGVGEVMIGVCYGWLPVAVGSWLQAHSIVPWVHWLSVPIALTIFNVIFINEFPDYEADRAYGKRNLVVRWGKAASSKVYAATSVAAAAATFVAVKAMGWPAGAYAVVAAPALLAAVNGVRAGVGQYREPRRLESICGVGIVVNVTITAAFIINVALYGAP